jgi:protein-tyrosine phosphatase
VLVGGRLFGRAAARALEAGVTAVLDLSAELSEAECLRTRSYLNLPVLDLTAPPVATLEQAVEFIAREAARGRVYVHCKLGYSRCAAAAGAYLLDKGIARSPEEAVSLLRSRRPGIVVRPEVLEALRASVRGRSACSSRNSTRPA